MRPLPHLRIIRFPPKKRVAFCSAAKEGGRGGRLKTCPHGLLLLFFSGLTDPGRLCPYPGFPLFDPAPACIPAAQPETHPAQPRARGFPLPRGKPTQSKEDGKKARYRKRAPACKKASSFLGRTLLCFGFAGAGRPRAGPSVALGGHWALSAQTRQARHFSLFQLAPLGAPAPDVALLPVQKLLRFSPALPKPAAPCPAFHGALLSEAKARLGAKNPAPWKRAGFFFFVKKGQQWGTCPPVAIRFSASSR